MAFVFSGKRYFSFPRHSSIHLIFALIFVLSGVFLWNVFQTAAFNRTLHGGTHFAAISAWLHVVSLLCCRETNLSRLRRSSSPSLPLRGYILVISCCLIKSDANYTQIESTNWIHFTLTNISLVLWEGKSERFCNYTHYISWRWIPQTSPQNSEQVASLTCFIVAAKNVTILHLYRIETWNMLFSHSIHFHFHTVQMERFLRYQYNCVCYLKSLSYSLQHVRDDGVIPEVSEPNPGSLNVHGTGQEETRSYEPQEKTGKTVIHFLHADIS